MTSHCRLLTQADYDAYESFLKPLTATSMFLRGNAHKGGMEFNGQRLQAHYFGCFIAGALSGVVGLTWMGNVMVQVPDAAQLDELFAFARQQRPDYEMKGVLGPDAQCRQVIGIMGIQPDQCKMSETENGYTLPLTDIIVPAPLQSGEWHVRRAVPADAEKLTAWDRHYDVEALGEDPNNLEPYDVSYADELRRIEQGNAFVLDVDGVAVSRSHFNTTLPDVVQIGGVYTPPENRSRGYARAAVAGQLLIARTEGVQQAVLFAKDPAAKRAYESIGFKRGDDYHITLLKQGLRLGA